MQLRIVGAVGVLCVFLAAACGGGGSTPASETASPAAGSPSAQATAAVSPPAGATGVAGTPGPQEPVAADFRTFAGQLNDALAKNDITFFLDRVAPQHVVCSAEDAARQDFFASCAEAGEEYDGLGLGVWQSDTTGVVPVQRVLALISGLGALMDPEATDAYGGAQPVVYALGANQAGGVDTQLALITAIIQRPEGLEGTGPLRVVLVTHWLEHEGNWYLYGVVQGVQYIGDLLDPTDAGRTYVQSWERFQP